MPYNLLGKLHAWLKRKWCVQSMSGQCQHDVHVSADLDAEIKQWFGEADIIA